MVVECCSNAAVMRSKYHFWFGLRSVINWPVQRTFSALRNGCSIHLIHKAAWVGSLLMTTGCSLLMPCYPSLMITILPAMLQMLRLEAALSSLHTSNC